MAGRRPAGLKEERGWGGMSLTPKDQSDDKAAESEFQRVLGNLAAMPPQPHKKPSPAVPGRKRGRPKKEH